MKEFLTNTSSIGTVSFTEGAIPLAVFFVQSYGLNRTSLTARISPCYNDTIDRYPLDTTQIQSLAVVPKGFGLVDMTMPELFPPTHESEQPPV